jgi:hypothetical protein
MENEIDAVVWHDLDGTILAVGHATPGHEEQVQPLPKPHQRVLKVRVQKDLLKRLHHTHRVDVITGVLRAGGESAG